MVPNEFDLKKSMDRLGPLVPIIKNKRTGHLIDGRHRQDFPNVPIYEIDISEELEPLARLAINNARKNGDMDTLEWEQVLGQIIGIEGKKPEEIADITGLHVSTIYRHMPQNLKSEKAKAISEGRQEQVARATSYILHGLCDNCKVNVPTEELKLWNNHKLCEKCLPRALENPTSFHRRFQILDQSPPKTKTEEPQRQPSYKETAEFRVAQMHPGISKMDEAMLIRLQNNAQIREKGWRVVFQKHYVITEVISDVTLEKGEKEIPIFWDGPCHVGKEDRDEANRAKIKRRHPHSLEPLVLAYAAASEKEFVQLEEKVLESLPQ